MSESSPDLSEYAGTGEDLTQEQREYLATYALHEPVQDSDANAETSAGMLADEGEGEWA
jgi:hypothetical protein